MQRRDFLKACCLATGMGGISLACISKQKHIAVKEHAWVQIGGPYYNPNIPPKNKWPDLIGFTAYSVIMYEQKLLWAKDVKDGTVIYCRNGKIFRKHTLKHKQGPKDRPIYCNDVEWGYLYD